MKKFCLLLALCLLTGCAGKPDESQSDPEIDPGIDSSSVEIPNDAPTSAPTPTGWTWVVQNGMGVRQTSRVGEDYFVCFIHNGDTRTYFTYYDEWWYVTTPEKTYHITGDFSLPSMDEPKLLPSVEGYPILQSFENSDLYVGEYDGHEDCQIIWNNDRNQMASVLVDQTTTLTYNELTYLPLVFEPYAELEEMSAADAMTLYNQVSFTQTYSSDEGYVSAVNTAPTVEPAEDVSGSEEESEPEETESPDESSVESEPEESPVPTEEPSATEEPTVQYVLIVDGDYTNIYGCYSVFGNESDVATNAADPESATFQFSIGDKLYCWPTCPVENYESVSYDEFRALIER